MPTQPYPLSAARERASGEQGEPVIGISFSNRESRRRDAPTDRPRALAHPVRVR